MKFLKSILEFILFITGTVTTVFLVLGGIVGIVYLISYLLPNPKFIDETKCELANVGSEEYRVGKRTEIGQFGGFICGDKLVSMHWENLTKGVLDGSQHVYLQNWHHWYGDDIQYVIK